MPPLLSGAPAKNLLTERIDLLNPIGRKHRPGELVADICAGSGTTAVVALNAGRRFVCFETAPAFYAAASECIHAARPAVKAGEKGV